MDTIYHDDVARYLIRKIRKELGLRQEDIADLQISPASISNFESGKAELKGELFDYLLGKLNLYPIEKFKHLLLEEKKVLEELQFQLHCIENIIEQEDIKTAREQLELVQIQEFHPLAPYLIYLKGCLFYKMKEWNRAKKTFHLAIRLCRQHKLNPPDNIIANCYNMLSRASYNQNNLEQALTYVNQGLKEFDPTKTKKYIQHVLYTNKILYLLNSSQYDHASQILSEVWSLVPQIKRAKILLNLYNYRAILLRIRGEYEEAIATCKEGIRIALRDEIHNRYLDLLLVLGSIHLKKSEYDKAFHRFQMVLYSDKELKYLRRHIDAHTYLGILFMNKKSWKKSSDHLTVAISKARKVEDIFRLAKALIVQGDLHVHQSQYHEAIPFYQEAVEVTEKYGYTNRQYTALFQLTHCFDMIGNKEECKNRSVQLYILQKKLGMKSEVEVYD